MDVTLALAGLIEESSLLLSARDYEGAEILLMAALSGEPKLDSHLHHQMGRLYVQWNKMTSAINHYSLAAELAKTAGDEFFVMQVVQDLKAARQLQSQQAP